MINLSLLSKYRKECMSISIIMIMFCHINLSLIGNDNIANEISIIQMIAQVGVDIFLLLSGVGLYFSMSKDSNLINFYMKRIKRIIVPYLIVAIFYSLFMYMLGLCSLKESIYNFSLITFFTKGVLNEWFIASILVLYCLFPLIYRLANRNCKLLVIISACLIVLSFAFAYIIELPRNLRIVNEIFIVRIPTFILGCIIGKYIINKKNEIKLTIRISVIIFFIILLICVLVAHAKLHNLWWLLRLLYMPLSLFLLIVLTNCFFDNKVLINRAISGVGGITLEIYLLHEKIQNITYYYLNLNISNNNLLIVFFIIINALIICLTLLLSVGLNKLSKFLTNNLPYNH